MGPCRPIKRMRTLVMSGWALQQLLIHPGAGELVTAATRKITSTLLERATAARAVYSRSSATDASKNRKTKISRTGILLARGRAVARGRQTRTSRRTSTRMRKDDDGNADAGSAGSLLDDLVQGAAGTGGTATADASGSGGQSQSSSTSSSSSSTGNRQPSGFVYPWYGAQSFGGKNPWLRDPGTSGVAADLAPMAPMDQVSSRGDSRGVDILPPTGIHASTFPMEAEAVCRDAMETELEDRTIIARDDRLRSAASGNGLLAGILPGMVASGAVEDASSDTEKRLGSVQHQATLAYNYPLQSPFDAVYPNPPTAPLDAISPDYARFLNQLRGREKNRQQGVDKVQSFKATDANADSMITFGEFKNLLVGKYGKAEDETQELWNLHKVAGGETMTALEFQKLFSTGFDSNLHVRTREDLLAYVSPPCVPNLGGWGEVALCPVGSPVVKTRIQRQPTLPNTDNKGVTMVEMECADGTVLKSSNGAGTAAASTGGEGDSNWSDWNACSGSGSNIAGFRSQLKVFAAHLSDNSGINDLSFLCRNGESQVEELRFVADVDRAGDGATVVDAPVTTAAAAAPVETIKTVGFVGAGADSTKKVTEGSWSNRFFCRSSPAISSSSTGEAAGAERVCGFQTRTGEIGEDGLGVTDLRLYCCTALERRIVGFYLMEDPQP